MTLVADTSALIAIALGEPERGALVDLLLGAAAPTLSAVTYVETGIVLATKSPGRDLDGLIQALGLKVVAFDTHQARAAVEAFAAYGKGRHPAALNFGDCCSYALAKTSGRPLLFKGDDFAQTDVATAA